MAVTKKMLESIIKFRLSEHKKDKLLIRYEGFIGRGINGVSSNSIWLMDYPDESVTVNYIKQYDGKEEKTIQLGYELEEDYLIAAYQHYCRDTKYNPNSEWEKDGSRHSVIIPYDRISSLEIRYEDKGV